MNRRLNRCLIAVSLSLALEASAQPEEECDQDWPTYNHDLAGSRHACDEAGPAPESARGLAVRWRFPTTAPVLGTPSVAGGHIYAGDMSGTVYALNRDGTLQWKTAGLPAILSTTPLVAGKLLIVGDAGGGVNALERSTGAIKWTVHPNPHPLAAVWGSPILVGRNVIMGMASNEESATLFNPNYHCCSFRGSVFSLDAETGALNWQTYLVDAAAQAKGTAGVGVWSTPTYDIETGTIYIGTGNAYHGPDSPNSDALAALDGATGALVWVNQRTAGDISTTIFPAPPGINDSDFGDSPKVFRLANGRKVVGAGEKNGFLIVCDAATGALVTGVQYLPPASNVGAFQNGIAHAGHLFFTNGTDWPDVLLDPHNPFPPPTAGVFFAIHDDGSGVAWQFRVPGSINQTGIAVANGVVYG